MMKICKNKFSYLDLIVLFSIALLITNCKKNDNNIQQNTLKLITSSTFNITDNSAVCSGNILQNEGYAILKKGILINKNNILDTSTLNSKTYYSNDISDSFNVLILNLEPNNTYHYKAFIISTNGIVFYGADSTFTTKMQFSTPNTLIDIINNISINDAQVNCNTIFDGNSPIIQQGIVISVNNHNPTIADTIIQSTSLSKNFSISLNSLIPNTTYYVRAYAINTTGIGYSIAKIFTTQKSISLNIFIDSIVRSSTIYFANDAFCSIQTNSSISKSGIVVSSVNNFPTVADTVLNSSTNSSNYKVSIDYSQIISGRLYYTRAYAEINGIVYYSKPTTLPLYYENSTHHYTLYKNGYNNAWVWWASVSNPARSYSLTNNLTLPNGIQMYVVIDSVVINPLCTNCTLKKGDSTLVPFGQKFYFFSYTSNPNSSYSYISASAYLKGTITDNNYFCYIDMFPNSGNTYFDYFLSSQSNAICETK